MAGERSLVLPTPGEEETAASSPADLSPYDDKQATSYSRAFGFPFPKAYDIQIDLMRNVFRAIEDGKIGVFESPTGTGKSLSLICSAFTWLRRNRERAERGLLTESSSLSSDEPDWVIKHQLEKKRSEFSRHEAELRERIRAARNRRAHLKKEAKSSAIHGSGSEWQRRKKQKQADDISDGSDSEFLASDLDTEAESSLASGRVKSRRGVLSYAKKDVVNVEDDYSNLSPQVRALMAQFEAEKKARLGPLDDDEEPETIPRIVYASRTHSQLSQFVAELRKTRFGSKIKMRDYWSHTSNIENDDRKSVMGEMEDDPIRVISLGSRKQMCINPVVQELGRKAGTEAMNERCLELLKGKGTSSQMKSKRCDYLPPQDQDGRAQILDFRDQVMAEVGDIEDLVQTGKEMKTCPYFAARASARQAELVTLPYNLLLQKEGRASLGISLKDCVVLIDEAHNLIDNILSTHTVTVTMKQIEQALDQVNTYLARFSNRLKGVNEEHLRKVRSLLEGLLEYCKTWSQSAQKRTARRDDKTVVSEEVVKASEFVSRMGRNLDQINLVRLESWLKDTQIARKISGYSEMQANRKAAESETKSRRGVTQGVHDSSAGSKQAHQRPSAIHSMHAIEAFILSLANRTEDGRVLLRLDTLSGSSQVTASEEADTNAEGPGMKLKYQLLNPSHVFKSLVDEARSIILAGGTMEPISDFQSQLVPSLDRDRFTTFSCGHIIPPSNLLALVLANGPKGTPFEFKYESRKDPAVLDELGLALVNLCNLIPGGLVIFLPSYGFLESVMSRWSGPDSSILNRMEAKKRVFLEPKTTMGVDEVLREYTLAIDAPSKSRSGGAVLFAVVGAKLSEGINFADQLARCVVMVGMPFANSNSPELQERMRYVRDLGSQTGVAATHDPGNELYTNMCMKAVNQSIGRAIRHRNDYASLILLDRRYGRADITARLPGWIRKEVTVAERFGVMAQRVGSFFREKRAAESL